ncbi:MAG: 16S rRNA (guanine(966)-N(2))-methyltransferase RsmD [Bryobacterales bacterium]|nr:16S rRNA (guanine(966)-N(2))-methyltransferase RsmD [Bryobacterales bacterium]MBV9396738.1 16S rRNA (guanine(966)-N(2))-methyltransferase RsmD [Bryobacterales bacterium]
MRVIGGEFRSRLLKSLPGLDVRPTPDRLREALFNVLAPRIDGVIFADVYAGTGAVGIEALSRGAARAIFIEQNRGAIAVIRANLKSLGVESRAQILQARARTALFALRADIVFLDPPYRLENEYAAALEALGARPPSLVIVQHDVRVALPESVGRLERTRKLRQSDNVLTFYEPRK